MSEDKIKLEQFKEVCTQLIDETKTLNDGTDYALKAYLCVNLFMSHLEIFPSDAEPSGPMIKKVNDAIQIIRTVNTESFGTSFYPKKTVVSVLSDKQNKYEFEDELSTLFSNVWFNMTDDIYFEESYDSLVERFKLNDLDATTLFQGKKVLDAGCGSGKFACAISRLGARHVTGVDLNKNSIAFAGKQAVKANLDHKMDFKTGSVCELPFDTDSFDFIWSNGVIHHTTDYSGAIKDIYRVLKKGGQFFIYVNGRWGMLEVLTDALKEICRSIPPSFIKNYCESIGMHTGRIYWLIDNLYAPYEWKSREDVISILENAGFQVNKQLTRGLEIDQIEMVSQNIPYARLKYGDAQLKFLCTKN